MSLVPEQPQSDPRLKKITLALAFSGAVMAGLLPWVFAQLPANLKPWNLQIIGAIGLFAAARLGFWTGVGFTGLAIGCKDLSVNLIHGYPPYYLSWPYFILYAALGSALVRRSPSPLIIGGSALLGSLLFFAVSNFVCWLPPSRYPNTLAGLQECYIMAVPFFRGTIAGDLVFSVVLFGAQAVFSRSYHPAVQPLRIPMEEEW